MADQPLFDSGEGIDPEVVEAARAELAAKLPELLKLPGFPIGSDEDILKMSVPPYYTACPNPFIEDWLAATTPVGQEDRDYVDPGPFASDVSASKGHRIYKAHSYWTKVPHELIMRYILHYTKPGDVVLDGFAGTGMTGVAAQACGAPEPKIKAAIEAELGDVEWGARRAVLQDLAPVASFIAAGLNLPVDADAFDEASQRILDEFEAEWGWMYETTHTDGSTARIEYTVWSEVFTCPSCGGEIVFYDAAFDESTGRVSDDVRCPHCGSVWTKRQLDRRFATVQALTGEYFERISLVPVRIQYRYNGQVMTKHPDVDDLEVLRRIQGMEIGGFPTGDLPIEEMAHGSRLAPKGFTKTHYLWPDRALVSLASLWYVASDESDSAIRAALLFWIEQALWGLSWMNRHKANDYSQVNRYQTGVYYIASLISECSPSYNLEGSTPSRGKRQSLVKTWGASPARVGRALTSTGSSEAILMPDDSVDYVFVDPPFGENIPYADLDLVIESWHGVLTNVEAEAIIDDHRGKDLDEYQAAMERCFDEFERVLKPGRWMTVEFSNSSNDVWLAIQQALSRSGFVVADTRVLDKQQGSYRQVTAKNAVKRDLVISCYKPSQEVEERFAVTSGSTDGAWEFVAEHLAHLPIVEGARGDGGVVRERLADRLYDRMVAFHVHRGVAVPMTAAEFYSILEQRFPVRDDMYFLPEQIETYERHRMTFKDLAQLELFITNEASAVQWLRQLLKKTPLTYAEIQPRFFEEVQAGLAEWEELPELQNLLEESFLQDDSGRWYVPDPKKAVDLEKARTQALLREFDEYASGKGPLTSFRSEAIRAGFKEAWSSRDLNTIVAVGERLPSDAFVEDQALLFYYDNARTLVPQP